VFCGFSQGSVKLLAEFEESKRSVLNISLVASFLLAALGAACMHYGYITTAYGIFTITVLFMLAGMAMLFKWKVRQDSIAMWVLSTAIVMHVIALIVVMQNMVL